MPPQRRQAQGVRGVVGQIESALQGEALAADSFSRAWPERSSPANSFASGGPAFKGFPGPHRLSHAEDIGPPDQPNLGLRQDARHEGAVLL